MTMTTTSSTRRGISTNYANTGAGPTNSRLNGSGHASGHYSLELADPRRPEMGWLEIVLAAPEGHGSGR